MKKNDLRFDLRNLIWALQVIIDSGEKESVDEIIKHCGNKNVVHYLESKYAKFIPTIIKNMSSEELETLFYQNCYDEAMLDKKYVIKNNALCYLTVVAMELLDEEARNITK